MSSRQDTRSAPRAPLAVWHLLSLDAPTVAATWTLFIAWSARVRLSLADPLAMFVAVWLLYAADRLLDARPLSAGPGGFNPRTAELEERHRFHHRHRAAFLRCIVVATLPLAFLLHRLAAPVLHLYALLAALLAGWLLLVHAQPAPSSTTRRLPKELAVGIFFPAAVFIPTVARAPQLQPALFPGALLFAGVCSLNCLMLYAWEHPHDRSRAHATTRWALRHLVALGSGIVAASAALAVATLYTRPASWPDLAALPHAAGIALCCALSAALLLLLHRLRSRIAPLHLRAFADLVLLTPLLIPVLSRIHLLP